MRNDFRVLWLKVQYALQPKVYALKPKVVPADYT